MKKIQFLFLGLFLMLPFWSFAQRGDKRDNVVDSWSGKCSVFYYISAFEGTIADVTISKFGEFHELTIKVTYKTKGSGERYNTFNAQMQPDGMGFKISEQRMEGTNTVIEHGEGKLSMDGMQLTLSYEGTSVTNRYEKVAMIEVVLKRK